MNIRKIALAGGFAAGALALAPLAAAGTGSFDFNDILAGEVSSMNSQFEGLATLAGVPSDDIVKGTTPLAFDTIDSSDLTKEFSTLLFGFNPDNVSTDPGAYSLYNGATIQFTDASNVLLYAMLNNGDTIPAADASDFLLGSESGIEHGLAGGNVFADAGNFFQAGLADLAGYFDFSGLSL